MPLTTEMHLPSEQKREGHTFTYTGKFRYMITLPTHESRPIFTDNNNVLKVLDCLGGSSRAHHFEVIAYCFLPEKLVVVIGGKEETSDMRAFLAGFRASSVSMLEPLLRHPVWSKRYLERVVRRGEDLRAVVRELFRLPVKAGLADSPTAYPFQGSFTGLTPAVTLPPGSSHRQRAMARRPGAAPRRPGGGKRGGPPRGH
jgi:hypothetical protein